jgi:hypothetical protein
VVLTSELAARVGHDARTAHLAGLGLATLTSLWALGHGREEEMCHAATRGLGHPAVVGPTPSDDDVDCQSTFDRRHMTPHVKTPQDA